MSAFQAFSLPNVDPVKRSAKGLEKSLVILSDDHLMFINPSI